MTIASNVNDAKLDMAFLHPPSSFAKLRYPLSGIFESTTGTTDILTMAPVGMFSLANSLEQSGYRVGVFNVAKVLLQQRQDPSVDVWKYVEGIQARIYGIGLHWSAHAPGAIELAERIKMREPASLIVFGGLTATVFKEELLEHYPFIDVVVLGECEHVITPLVQALLLGERDLSALSNVAFRKGSTIQVNPITLPQDFERASFFPYPHLLNPKPGPFDREGMMQHYPLLRGCDRDCRFCGGSRHAYATYFGRPNASHPGISHFRGFLQDMIASGSKVLRLYGDTRTFGPEFDGALRTSIGNTGHRFDAALEVFTLPSRDYLQAWRQATDNLVIIFSPESTFQELRAIHGKDYSNDDIHRLADWCSELKISLVFSLMYAMPGHTKEKILGELTFFEEMLQRHPDVFMAFQPYLYLDPGCEIFTHPEKYGTRIQFKNLHDIIEGLTRPHWYYSIGYDLDGLNRDELFETILEVSIRKAQLYHKYGQLSAVNLLRTFENVHHQRRIYDFIKRERPSDPALDAFIRSSMPSYLRSSNSSLVQRPFMGSIIQTSYPLDAALYDAFPLLLEIMLRFDLLPIEEFVAKVGTFRSAHPPAENRSLLELKDHIIPLFQEAVEQHGLHVPFLKDLVEFEWLVYAFFYQPGHPPPDDLTLRSAYNFDSLQGFLDGVRREGSELVADRNETTYVFSHGALVAQTLRSRRRINIFSRKTFRLAPSLKNILRSQHGIDCDQDYQELPI